MLGAGRWALPLLPLVPSPRVRQLHRSRSHRPARARAVPPAPTSTHLPTCPTTQLPHPTKQVYVKGELLGGCDIVLEMAEAGELKETIGEMKARM